MSVSLGSPTLGHTDEVRCNKDIAASAGHLMFSHHAQLNRCIKFGNYDCEGSGSHVVAARSSLQSRVAKPNGACGEAVNSGTPLSDFGPGSACPASGGNCDEVVPELLTLDDLAACLSCAEDGLAADYRSRLGLPADVPDNSNERKCVRSFVRETARAIRLSRRVAEKCSKRGMQPFDCEVDDTPNSKFGDALEKLAGRIAKCRDASGVPGMLSGDAAALCDGGSPTIAALADCAGAIARCQACRHANLALGQTQDCVAFSDSACAATQ